MLDTGFATRNNNDHVLTFDGTMLGISHHSADDKGQSVVYTLPSSGGTPKRITAKSPSYFHGFSPDAKWLVFTGQRDGELDIYRISADGGEEIPLTTTKGVDDGPEYTPGRAVGVLQLDADGTHADLADEAGRHQPGADHERRVQQLVPAPVARRQDARGAVVRHRRRARAITRSTGTSTSGR